MKDPTIHWPDIISNSEPTDFHNTQSDVTFYARCREAAILYVEK